MAQPLIKLTLFLFAVLCTSIPLQAAVTPEQRARVKELTEATRAAGQLYNEQKMGPCAEKIREVQKGIIELMKTDDAALHRLVRPIYTRLGRAHGLLELEGAELDPLPSWKELTEMGDRESAPEMQPVSFTKELAPWLVSACGNCHINNQRGQFAMRTYRELMQGTNGRTVLFPGSSRGSRIVEVIESGDMPRGGGEVSDAQLSMLKRWIDEGAKFDGSDPAVNLSSFASGENAPAGRNRRPNVNQPTGSETVSFSKDVAPILLENCNGCHIAGRRASGNLRMDSFAQMLRGGDSGELIMGTNANESLLIKKLRGQAGQRMPAGGRPPLSEEQISTISTWIREGAAFDGPSPNTEIDVVVSQGWANDASHAELFQRRKQRAQEIYGRVLPKAPAATAENDELLVLGNVAPSVVERTLDRFTRQLKHVKKQLDAPAREPLVKGGIVVFVLKSRYDYSEFGRMIENRELPRQWLGHWDADPLDVYAAIAYSSEIEDKQADALATQLIAGAYMGSLGDVPTWFAEGVGRNLVVEGFQRGDERVAMWRSALVPAVQKMENAKTLLDGRLDEEAAGLVGMGVTQAMRSRANRRRFDKLHELLREGRPFSDAMTFAFGPPEKVIQSLLGK